MKYKNPCHYSKTGWAYVKFDDWGASCSCRPCLPPKDENHYKVLYKDRLIPGQTEEKLEALRV